MKWPFGVRTSPATETSERSFRDVVMPHLDSAYALARWLVRDPHLAEDVVQDAILRGLSYFASFRGGDERAWLMRIVRNTAYSALAARARSKGRPVSSYESLDDAAALEVVDPGDDPELALIRQAERAALEQAILALPVELRECLVLKEFEELSYKEIATITGVPIGTVMSRLWRARRTLQDRMLEGASHDA
ncbi:RNA polymerase sigma-70 factor, ECF subfamily [Arboricoccus pini]|uniref:RNA polymerase sigma factor n=1 Tax=Arboricoccus pini TaxID=1963835 RepID=A0A212RL41_9PROT|nr:sigma-70 family RNA polymerase sigma factor [Arboricoccus pini]SNB73188.1 RNA polymerase sigma-70 factor, ECF subfamily [Arboricoccus pini]